MVAVWRGLKAMGLVHTEVGETDFKYWDYSMRDLDDERLMAGLKKAQDHTGFLTLGGFRNLCKPEETAPCHQAFQGLPKPRMTVEQRKAAMAKLRAEVGI